MNSASNSISLMSRWLPVLYVSCRIDSDVPRGVIWLRINGHMKGVDGDNWLLERIRVITLRSTELDFSDSLI